MPPENLLNIPLTPSTAFLQTPAPPLDLEAKLDAYLNEKIALLQPLTHLAPASVSHPAQVAQQIYAKLTSYRFCKQRPTPTEPFLQVIQQAVEEGQPIPMIVGHGPQKNANNCATPQVDWAECFLLIQLGQLNQAIQKLYSPGLQIQLYLDDARAACANNIPQNRMDDYRHSLCQLITDLKATHLIHNVVSLQTLYPEFNVTSHLTEAETCIAAYFDALENCERAEKDWHSASKNLPLHLPPYQGLSPEALANEVRQAARRYRIYLEAENRSGLWHQPNTLYARFNSHPGFLQIFTLRKGSITQPWQGKGCLRLTPTGKLEPYVLTRSTQEKVQLMFRHDQRHLATLGPLDLVSDLPEQTP